MIRGRAVTSVASTRVSVPARPLSFSSRDPASLGERGNQSLNSSMIPTSRSGSKTVAASDSDPNAARAQPSFFCTFCNSLACGTARSNEQMGLNKYRKTIRHYWS